MLKIMSIIIMIMTMVKISDHFDNGDDQNYSLDYDAEKRIDNHTDKMR